MCSRGSVTVVGVPDRIDAQLVLVEQWYDQFGIVTVRKHEQEVIRSHELEPWEGLSLAVHEFVQRSLAHIQLCLDLAEFDVQVRRDAKVLDVLGLHAHLQLLLDLVVYDLEAFAWLLELFFDLLRPDEESLQLGPCTLDVTQ